MQAKTPATWASDTNAISNWHLVEIFAKSNGREIRLLSRILGWDGSPLPVWVQPAESARLRVKVSEIPGGPKWPPNEEGEPVGIRGLEVRRLEPRMDSFLEGEPAVDHWGLRLPCVTYEAWCDEKAFEEAKEAWLGVPREDLAELADTGLLPTHVATADGIGGAGFAGSTMIHVPQIRPFFPDLDTLVLPGGHEAWGRLMLVSNILDGTVDLSASGVELVMEGVRSLNPMEAVNFLKVHCPPKSFGDLNGSFAKVDPAYLAAHPSQQVVGQGADLELTLIPEHGPPCRMTWGLVKSVRFTLKAFQESNSKPAISKHLVKLGKEPWIERVPQFGYSVPAEIQHIPPGNPQAIFLRLSKAGSVVLLCDPYVTKNTLAKVLGNHKECKLLATAKALDRIGVDWCRENGIEAKIISDDEGGVHDRLLLGNDHAYVLGTSLTGLGNRHSFIIEADNKMRWVLREVFEKLWEDAPAHQTPRQNLPIPAKSP